MRSFSEFAKDVHALTEEVSPQFSGREPTTVGATLSELVSRWLAGHIMPGDPKATDEYREMLLKMHIDCVRSLLKEDAKITEKRLREMTQ